MLIQSVRKIEDRTTLYKVMIHKRAQRHRNLKKLESELLKMFARSCNTPDKKNHHHQPLTQKPPSSSSSLPNYIFREQLGSLDLNVCSTLSTACAFRSALLERLFSLNLLWRNEALLLKVVRIFGNLADVEVDDDDDR